MMAVTHRDGDDLRVGDRVFDRVAIEDPDEEPSLGIVIATSNGACGDTSIEQDGDEIPLHEYGPNADYAGADDDVVSVVFADWLDGNIPQWDVYADHPAALIDHLEEMVEVWSIPVAQNSYDYPAPRLSLRFRPD